MAPRPLRSWLLALAALAAGACAAPAPPPPPDDATLPLPTLGLDLRGPAARARGAVERLLGRPVPGEAAVPQAATEEEMVEALVEELRPQVDMLHPRASAAARDLALRSLARASARSVLVGSPGTELEFAL